MSPWASIQITAKSSPKYLLVPASDPKAKEWSPPTINGKVSFSNASKTLEASPLFALTTCVKYFNFKSPLYFSFSLTFSTSISPKS